MSSWPSVFIECLDEPISWISKQIAAKKKKVKGAADRIAKAPLLWNKKYTSKYFVRDRPSREVWYQAL